MEECQWYIGTYHAFFEDAVKKILIIFLQLTLYALTVSTIIILTYFVLFINAFNVWLFSEYMVTVIYTVCIVFGLYQPSHQHSFAFKPFRTLVSLTLVEMSITACALPQSNAEEDAEYSHVFTQILCDAVPTSSQHRMNVSCLLGWLIDWLIRLLYWHCT